jgi:hypothetical protein
VSRCRHATPSGDQDAQIFQQFATAFAASLACLLQQIISKMKLFIPTASMPEIAAGNAWSDAPRLTMPRHGTVKPSYRAYRWD